jgi:type I restriction enzyme S subunit
MPELDLPQDWEQKTLIDLAGFINGFPFKPSDWSETGLPIVRIAQITGSSTACDYFRGSINHLYKLETGDIVFSWSGTLCVVRWRGGQAWLNQHLFRVIPSPNIDNDFFFHLLSHAVESMEKSAHGSTMKHIKRGELKKYNVATPVWLEEQQKIAQILDTLDTQIQKTESLIAKLERIKEGLLHDLLTRGIDQNGQLRPTPEQAPVLYKESALGLIPKEWEVRQLGSMAIIVSGVTLGGQLPSSSWPLVAYLRVANVQDGYLDLKEVKFLRVKPADVEKFRLVPGDVLMNEGGDFDKLGRGTVWEGEIEQCIHQNHVFRVRTFPNMLDPYFLAYFSGSSMGKSYFIKSSKQSTNLASINSTQLKAFHVPVPPFPEQMSIINRLKSHKKRLDMEIRNLEKLRAQKTGLMDDLLSGHVRVTTLLKDAV